MIRIFDGVKSISVIYILQSLDFLYGNLSEPLLDFLVGGRFADEPIDGLGVVNVLKVTELWAEHLLGEELTEDTCSLGADVGQGEVVA